MAELKQNCDTCIHGNVCHIRETCYNIEKQLKEFGCNDFLHYDVVEVVRCKNCERRNKSADLTDTVYCRYLKLTMPKDAFCNYGERNEQK